MGGLGSSVRVSCYVSFFPHFVREKMIRDLITFNFHEEGQSVREYIDRVFAAASILAYDVDDNT